MKSFQHQSHSCFGIRPFYLLLGIVLLFSACSPSIAPYSGHAYELAVDLKVDGLRLMDKAELPYAEFKPKVEALQLRMDKAYEFAAGRPKNDHSTEQWKLMNNRDGFLMAGFLQRWESESTLSSSFIREAKEIISLAFDSIIGLESGKLGGNQSK